MDLSGQAKIDFEKWYVDNYHPDSKPDSIKLQLIVFRSMTLAKQFGVYMDWSDSVGLEIQRPTELYSIQSTNRKYEDEIGFLLRVNGMTRNETIIKLNEIYNGQS